MPGGGGLRRRNLQSWAQDRPIQPCPVTQATVKNGARPEPELLKKLVRCSKGEKAAEKGYDGAVTVDVAALQIGEARKWSPLRDTGNGKLDTMVYPTKAIYSVRIAFGEWQSGSEEPVKSAEVKSIPR